MQKPLNTQLPADLPENWQLDQDVTPTGIDAGLTKQHGYNYQSKQINDAHKAINDLNNAFDNVQENLEVITTDTNIVDTDTVPVIKSDNTKKRISFLTIVNAIKTKFSTVFAPLIHTHGNITNTGAIGSIQDKAVMTGTNGVLKVDTLPVVAGGTGKTSFTAGQVLVGNGTGAVGQQAVDNTPGGTKDSPALITSGAVRAAIPPTIALTGAATSGATPITGAAMSIAVTSLDATKLVGVVPPNNGGVGVTDLNVNKLQRGAEPNPTLVIYLSPSGNDNNSGFSTTVAMRSIRAAVAKYGGLNRLHLMLAAGTYTDASTLEICGNVYVSILGTNQTPGSVVITHPIIFQSTDAKLQHITFDLSSSNETYPGVTFRQAKYDIQNCVFKGKTATHAGINVSLGSTGYIVSCTFQSGIRAVEIGSGAVMTALTCTVANVYQIGFNVNGGLLISGGNTNNAVTKFTMYNSAIIANDGLILNQATNTMAMATVV